MNPTGRVYVVQGDLTRLTCHDVLVPTDAGLSIEETWRSLVTREDAAACVPRHEWGDDGLRCCRVSGGDDADERRVWVVNVGSWDDKPLRWYLDGVEQAFERLTADGPGRSGRRLIALPLIGTGEGGLAERRGELISELLGVLDEQARKHGLDVALVTWSRSDYAAVQALRADSGVDPDLDDELEDYARRLAAEVVEGRLVLFLGAGVSAAAGLPAWWDLLERLAEYGAQELADLLPGEAEPAREAFRRELRSLGTLDAAELLRRTLGPAVVEAVVSELQHDRYSLTHGLLASLRASKTITTNYDRLYEIAAERPYENCGGLAVLPWDATEPGRPWLLKMHGDVERPESIVLSRGDFAVYETARRPLASLLQAHMLTGHLLFVGSSMTDDNVLRLAHEVRELRREWCADARPVGTVLTLADEPLRRRLWRGTLDFVLVGEGERDDEPSTRRLEAFLDRVAVLSAVERSHLLDPTYDALVGENAELRDALARLAATLGGLPGGSDPRVVEQVRSLLTSLGWSGDGSA
ncbi:MAG: SIR2 family protein [Actinomycetota bacterium]|nr:SIR2 family protein [Actinomycetota bacterium]